MGKVAGEAEKLLEELRIPSCLHVNPRQFKVTLTLVGNSHERPGLDGLRTQLEEQEESSASLTLLSTTNA